jgi:hypothetical protein
MPAAAFIYCLADPRSGVTRYVGKSEDPAKRFKQHLRESRRPGRKVHQWIRDLRALGLKPKLEIFIETQDWEAAERSEIAKCRAEGIELLNLTAGGDQPVHDYNRIWYLKRAIGEALKKGYVKESTRVKLRLCAAKRPDLFGCYANI